MKSIKEIDDDGAVNYYNEEGELHREDGPAVDYDEEDPGVFKMWCINGKNHREDGPAITDYDGERQEWYINGKRHREDGPAVIELHYKKEWFINDKLHREDGPAVEYDGENSVLNCWYLNGVKYSEQEYKAKMRRRKLKQIL